MTTGGWIFLVTCWSLLTALTVYCFKVILAADDKKSG